MFNRCNKDLMGYCNGKAEWEVQPIKIKAGNVELTTDGKCKLEPKTCGNYSSYPIEHKEQEINKREI